MSCSDIKKEFVDAKKELSDQEIVRNSGRRLIDEAGSKYKATGTISVEILLALHALFGNVLSGALDLVDRGLVTGVRGDKSGRRLLCVKGSSGIRYTIFESSHYCCCPSYQFGVLGKGGLVCKHLLAARIAEACGRVETEEVKEEQIRMMVEEFSL